MPRLLILLISLFLPSSAFSESIQQLETELNQKLFSRAAKTGLTLLREQPENVQAQFLTALAFQHNNQPDNAQRHYLQIIQKHPDLPEPRNNLAMIYMQKGQYDQAIDLLIASLKTHPAYATAWQNLNKLYQGLASEAYRKALSTEENPGSVMSKIQLSALSTLHDMPVMPVAVASRPVQLAGANTPINKPVKKPEITKKPQPVNPDELIETLYNWAENWSQKKFEAYINAYSKNYKGNRKDHRDWVEYRRTRILKPGSIQVKLSNFQIKSVSETRAIINFHQSFKSPSYKDKVVKRINLIKVKDSWKINRELTISVL